MTIKAEHYYTSIANTNNLQPPQMFQGAQYAMGEPGLRLPLYMLDNASLSERANSVTEDFEVALNRMSTFVTALMRKKMPDLRVESNPSLTASHTVAVRGLIRSIAPKTTTTGYLTDFRIETVHPVEIQEGVMNIFRRKSGVRTTDPVADSTVYLLNSAKLVQGSRSKQLGSITEVAPQGKALPDGGGFTELYEGPTCSTIRLGTDSELLKPALYETPAVLRVSAAKLF